MNDTKVCIFSLGCKTNQYESSCLATAFFEKGYDVYSHLTKADIYVINTCAVTNEAERKSRQAIQRARSMNKNAKIIVIGCAPQADLKNFINKDVDYIKGSYGKINLLDQLEETGVAIENEPIIYEELPKPFIFEKTRALLKIQDGCDNYCSYCVIPYVRGKSRSRLIKNIIEEAKYFENFFSEIVITGINIAAFGKDSNESIHDLVDELSKLKARFRFGSIYVEMINDELLSKLQKFDNFCPHFHLSLQSGSDSILKDMNRKYLTSDYKNAVNLIKKYFPNAGLTTDIIVGYPTESKENFIETINFVKEIKFSDIHIFKFSPKKGTKAALLTSLPKEIVNKRMQIMKEIKSQLIVDFLIANIGSTQEVIFEKNEDNLKVGYSRNYLKIYSNTNQEKANVICHKIYKDGLIGEVC
ncbi:MAG: tRNA (N(6)-L-threonylcarbamoyladenosine(37)-C(2))-methylthiotransferase MtaB [Christensenellales bacterium]|jgi:threonylcarbamoyladenosine tRNA methylthiotransferase MtaB|nr:tRNA (N(6)-L-threonylcarbamoyladenosine(37)-C(2))-methylthiotransferase MtaB [Clostridiales bacterium]